MKNHQPQNLRRPDCFPSIHIRYRLYDKMRIGQSAVVSPFGTVAAVTDSLGRVLLVDMHRGIIKRIWKGYRNAQVSAAVRFIGVSASTCGRYPSTC